MTRGTYPSSGDLEMAKHLHQLVTGDRVCLCDVGGAPRRLPTLASFYRYWQQEQLTDRNPALNVRRPKVDYKSRTLGLDSTSWAPSSSMPASARLEIPSCVTAGT